MEVSEIEKNKTAKKVSIKELKAEVDRLKEEEEKLKDQYLRLLAEFDTYRRRKLTESAETANNIKKQIILNLLPVLDDFNRLFNQSGISNDTNLDGVKLIADKFQKILTDFGLKPMSAKGEAFNPELHTALLSVEAKDQESGSVLEEFEPGYYLEDQVLRHAKVIVSK
jgi:molecular chaperone GrpE